MRVVNYTLLWRTVRVTSSILHELSCLLSTASISLITFTAVIHQTSDTMARPDRRGSEWGHIPFLQIALIPHSLLKTCKMFDKVGVRNCIHFNVMLNKRRCRDREDNPLPQTHRDVCAVWNSDLLNWRGRYWYQSPLFRGHHFWLSFGDWISRWMSSILQDTCLLSPSYLWGSKHADSWITYPYNVICLSPKLV